MAEILYCSFLSKLQFLTFVKFCMCFVRAFVYQLTTFHHHYPHRPEKYSKNIARWLIRVRNRHSLRFFNIFYYKSLSRTISLFPDCVPLVHYQVEVRDRWGACCAGPANAASAGWRGPPVACCTAWGRPTSLKPPLPLITLPCVTLPLFRRSQPLWHAVVGHSHKLEIVLANPGMKLCDTIQN